jgi:hypothetical protein
MDNARVIKIFALNKNGKIIIPVGWITNSNNKTLVSNPEISLSYKERSEIAKKLIDEYDVTCIEIAKKPHNVACIFVTRVSSDVYNYNYDYEVWYQNESNNIVDSELHGIPEWLNKQLPTNQYFWDWYSNHRERDYVQLDINFNKQ